MRPAVAAWGVFVLSAGLQAAAVGLAAAGGNPFEALIWVPLIVAAGGVGALIACHRGRNPVGWMLLAFAAITSELIVAQRYAALSLSRSGSLPGEEWAAWLGVWPIDLEIIPLLLALLTFPTGKPPSRRWWPVVWMVVVVFLSQSLLSALADANLSNNFPTLRHPLPLLPEGPSRAVYQALQTLALVLILVVLSSLVIRYRHSTGQQRQQMKWLAYAAVTLGVAILLSLFLEPLGIEVVAAFVVTGPALPIAVGIAILRYRLYDIDLVINRTLVYGALTALSAAVYVAGVVGLPLVLRIGRDNDLIVAGSTLAVAALFSPLRRRLQSFVDRRFYRRRYDARSTVEAFSSRLRDQVDLETLVEELQGVVRDTLAPASVGVWLRELEGLGR
jgi:hypothetical protein